MSLVRWNPAKELLNIEREFNRLFGDFQNRFGYGKDTDENSYENAVWSPLTDISETDKEYVLNLDLPGVSKKDLKISYDQGALKISGERRQENDIKDAKYHRVERVFGKYYRSFNLPDFVDPEKISAKFNDGQLKVVVPKTEKAKPKEIQISMN